MGGMDRERNEPVMGKNRAEDTTEQLPPDDSPLGQEPEAMRSGDDPGGTGEPPPAPAEEPAGNGGGLLEEARREWESEKKELTDRLLRQRADYENYKRIHRQELERSREDAVCDFIKALLPVLDNLERALGAAREEKDLPPAYTEGLELIYGQLLKLLEQEGVTGMVAEGKPFDPHYHHAVVRAEEGEGEPGIVAEELCRGYLYRDRVLRPAMVKVF